MTATKTERTQMQSNASVRAPIELMEKWAKEEACFKEAVIYDFITKKFQQGGWPREKPTAQQLMRTGRKK